MFKIIFQQEKTRGLKKETQHVNQEVQLEEIFENQEQGINHYHQESVSTIKPVS